VKIDVNKNAIDNVITLINDKNNTSYRAAELVLGIPGLYSDGAGRNTKLQVSGRPGGLYGSVEIHYKRLGLLVNVASPQITYDIYDTTTESELFNAVLAGLGLHRDEVAFVQTYTPALTSIQLRPKNNSLLYAGAAVTLTLNKLYPDIGNLFDQNVLNGFDAV
jgi:hypothetical protein